MNLTGQEIALFYKLWYGLIWGINEKQRVIARFKKPVYGIRVAVSIEEYKEVRDKMWDNSNWIDEFLADTDNGEFTEQERGMILLWRKYFVKGKFLVAKHLAKYSVLMSFDRQPNMLYGVWGISSPIKDAFPEPTPFLVDMVLLPFKDKIIYDSLASSYNISFGAGLRSAAKEWYDKAKGKYGILEVLNGERPDMPPSVKKPKKEPTKQSTLISVDAPVVPQGMNVPKAMAARYNEIAEIILRFCDDKLNEEYREISLRALAKLSRKRPSPLHAGKARTWACGIVYAIGSVNCIFDKSQSISMTASDIAGWFGLSKSTAGNKAAEIMNLLDISYMNTEYMVSGPIDRNP